MRVMWDYIHHLRYLTILIRNTITVVDWYVLELQIMDFIFVFFYFLFSFFILFLFRVRD